MSLQDIQYGGAYRTVGPPPCFSEDDWQGKRWCLVWLLDLWCLLHSTGTSFSVVQCFWVIGQGNIWKKKRSTAEKRKKIVKSTGKISKKLSTSLLGWQNYVVFRLLPIKTNRNLFDIMSFLYDHDYFQEIIVLLDYF